MRKCMINNVKGHRILYNINIMHIIVHCYLFRSVLLYIDYEKAKDMNRKLVMDVKNYQCMCRLLFCTATLLHICMF